jgi:hypothetical protein
MNACCSCLSVLPFQEWQPGICVISHAMLPSLSIVAVKQLDDCADEAKCTAPANDRTSSEEDKWAASLLTPSCRRSSRTVATSKKRCAVR